jgi:hypothetical protein
MFNFNLSRCVGYVAPEKNHRLADRSPLSGIPWAQTGTHFAGRTLRSQCSAFIDDQRCQNATDFDYRFCWHCLMQRYRLMVAPTTLPGLKGWGLFACDPKAYRLDAETKRPQVDSSHVVFQEGDIVGGPWCYFTGEYVTDRELDARYPHDITADYVVCEGNHRNIDGQIARTVLQFANDAICLATGQRNTPDRIVMHDWPVQNAESAVIDHRFCLIALTDIHQGAEILWDYTGGETDGPNYWSGSNKISSPSK